MMGQHKSDPQLFNYAVNLEKRVRAAHPLRRVRATIDFGFVREEVAHCYGKNGNESVAPEVILKMMFLLFFDDIKSERELMEVIGERLDYLWFLDYGLDQKIPDHSVLSKARARWGKEVFESLFVRTVAQCVEAGLVDGSKLHVDASLVDADAAKESVIKETSELITDLKLAYRATELSLAMKLLLTLHCITSIAVPPVKHSNRAECIPFAERSNIRHPPECVRSVFCVLNALALTMDAPCSGTKNKLS